MAEGRIEKTKQSEIHTCVLHMCCLVDKERREFHYYIYLIHIYIKPNKSIIAKDIVDIYARSQRNEIAHMYDKLHATERDRGI